MAGDFPLVNHELIDGQHGPRWGEHYREYAGNDSHGDPGMWHIYHDGDKIFVASPQTTSGSTGGTPAPTPPVIISQSSQPITGGSPPTAGSTGGTPAPAPPAVVNQTQQPTTSAPAPSYPLINPANGEHYYIEQNQSRDGVPGVYHVYHDGARIFVPNSGSTLGSTGGTPAPVAPSPITPAQAAAQSRALDIAGTDIAMTPGLTPPPAYPAPAPATPSPAAQAATQSRALDAAGTDIAMTPGLAPYTVEHGDTLSGIAEKHGVALSKLEGLNPQIKNPDLILPGETVNLGSGGGASTGFPTTSSYPPPPGAPQAETAAKTALSGWGAPGNISPDPIKGIMEAGKPETDPLKINNNKPHSA